jgi:uncharacterized protein (DUF2062 family)
MAKKFFKRWLPHAHTVKNHPKLQFFGTLLHDPNLWHLNRRSLSGAAAVGLFTSFLPVPLQMLIAAGLAIYFRVNLPLSMSLVWVTNPITIPPMFYSAYYVGCLLLARTPHHDSFRFSLEGMMAAINYIWQPLLLGSLILAIMSAALGYLSVQFLWRLHIQHLWHNRHERRAKKKPVLKDIHKSMDEQSAG